MLNRKNRLKKRKEFAYIYRKGEACHTRYLTLVCVPTKAHVARIGFSVSKKIGKAHLRNLIKRRLSSIVRARMEHINNNFNYVIIAKSGIDLLNFYELSHEVDALISKSGKEIS